MPAAFAATDSPAPFDRSWCVSKFVQSHGISLVGVSLIRDCSADLVKIFRQLQLTKTIQRRLHHCDVVV